MDIQGGEGTHPATQLEMTENSQAELSSGKTAPIFIKNNQLIFFGYAGSSLLRRFLSSCGEWGAYSWLLIAEASLVAEPGLEGTWASVVSVCGLSGCGSWAPRAGSVAVGHGPCCSVMQGIFPDQGLNLCLLHWQADSLPLSHQGSPISHHFFVFSFCNDDCSDLCVSHTCFQASSQSQALCGGQSEDGHDSRGPVLMKPLPQGQRISRHPRAVWGGRSRGQWTPLEGTESRFPRGRGSKAREE